MPGDGALRQERGAALGDGFVENVEIEMAVAVYKHAAGPLSVSDCRYGACLAHHAGIFMKKVGIQRYGPCSLHFSGGSLVGEAEGRGECR